MEEMTPAERRAFLQAGGRTGTLATVRPDGRPHVTPIWFVLDGVHDVALHAEEVREDFPDHLLVVDDEDARRVSRQYVVG